MDTDELRQTIERVEHDLRWSIWPHGGEARLRRGLAEEDLQAFDAALGSLEDARQALIPNTEDDVNLKQAIASVRAALEVLDLIPHWRIPNEVNAERAIALRDLGARIGR